MSRIVDGITFPELEGSNNSPIILVHRNKNGELDFDGLVAANNDDGYMELCGYVDYAQILNEGNLSNSNLIEYNINLALRGMGVAMNPIGEFGLFSLKTGELIKTLEDVFSINVKEIYDLTGSASFVIRAARGAYANFLNGRTTRSYELCIKSLTILSNPKKLSYDEGEYFDATGLVLQATRLDNSKDILSGYSILPNRTLTVDDNFITVNYKSYTIDVPILVQGLDGWGNAVSDRNKKELPFGDKMIANIDLNDGKVTAAFTSFNSDDFVLPLNISHLHKLGYGSNGLGLNWRLNLNKKLIKNNAIENSSFTYIDEFGDEYNFKESYYYIENGVKNPIDKENITIDIKGDLIYEDKDVRVQQHCNGFKLISEIDGFINSELIEQRQEEQIQIEEYVDQLEDALKDYVRVNSKSGSIDEATIITNFERSEYEALILGISSTSDEVVMTRSQAMQLQSLYLSASQLQDQKKQLTVQDEQIQLQIEQLEIQRSQTQQQYYDSDAVVKQIKFKYECENSPDDPKFGEEDEKDKTKKLEKMRDKANYESATKNMQILKEIKQKYDVQLSLFNKQKTSLTKQSIYLDEQQNSLQEQISFFIRQARENLLTVKETFIKYFSKKAERDLLNLRVPVNYLQDSKGIISGFNRNGDLVCLFDSFGNSVSIDYNKDNLINSVQDSKGKFVNFEYAAGLLQNLTDNCGRQIKFIYNEQNLENVIFADDTKLTLGYVNNLLCSVISSNNVKGTISYNSANNKISCLTNKASAQVISKGMAKPYPETLSYDETIFKVDVGYFNNKISFTYKDNEIEEYDFYKSHRIKSYSKQDNTNLKSYTTYDYSVNSYNQKTKVVRVFNGIKEESKTTEYFNQIDQVVLKIADWSYISDTTRVKYEIEYKYDSADRIKSENATKFIGVNGEENQVVSVVNYSYNAAGSLVLTESYVNGEELISGKNYEKRLYDENGNITKTISWNNLDSSTKFYQESERAETGQVIADLDESGSISKEYEYIDGTNIVNSVKTPNGGKLAYGRNPFNFEVTSITSSSENGEENTTDIVYEKELPVEIKSGKTTLDYTYDHARRKTAVKVNGVMQATYSYQDYIYNKSLNSCIFDGQTTVLNDGVAQTTILQSKIGVLDSESGRIKVTEVLEIDGDEKVRKEYDETGRLTSIKNGSATATYTYDSYDNVTQITDGSLTENYTYNEYGEVTAKALSGAVTQTYSYTYKDNAARDLDYISFGNYKFKSLTDVNGRNTGREVYSGENKVAAEYITYRKVGDHATNMPATVWFGSGSQIKDSIKYKYDSCGNICEITENGHVVAKYMYDSLNRLIREDNKAINKTVLYSYDQCGNITERCEYAYTSKTGEELSEIECEHFSYDYEGDKLVSYNNEAFAYNNLGCPTTYRGNSATWVCGKLLASYKGVTFTYNGLGGRASKNGITFTYDSDGRLLKQSNGLEFIYDNTGIAGVKHNGAQYFYRKDAQGNIIAILDSAGNIVVQYVYDAWGNHAVLDANDNDVTSGIGVLNPFRYRGYYYDTETELYYLQTRYYDPEIGRFISQDSIDYADPETINGLNLYAYCGNNPVMNVDPTGEFAITAFFISLIIGIGVGAAIGGTVNGIRAYNEGQRGWGLFGAIAGGALMGGAMGAVLVIGGAAGLASVLPAGIGIAGFGLSTSAALGISLAIGASANMIAYSLESGLRTDREWTWNGFFKSGAVGLAKGATTFFVGRWGGRMGAFDKILLNPMLKGASTLSKSITYDFAKGILAEILPGVGRKLFANFSMYLGEFLSKLLIISSSAGGVRWIVDKIFGN